MQNTKFDNFALVQAYLDYNLAILTDHVTKQTVFIHALLAPRLEYTLWLTP